MHLEFFEYDVVETYTTRIMGTNPANPELHAKFIAAKKAEHEEKKRKFAARHSTPETPNVGTAVEETEVLDPEPDERSGLTVFSNDFGQTDEETGKPGRGIFLWDYQVAGFFKEAAEITQSVHNIPQVRSKLDNFLFVVPRRVYFCGLGGEYIMRPDDQFERPLRAMTMQGPRVTLSASEYLNPGVCLKYRVRVLPFFKSGRGKEKKGVDTLDFLKLLLSMGEAKGRGQWRNGGNGRFTYTIAPA